MYFGVHALNRSFGVGLQRMMPTAEASASVDRQMQSSVVRPEYSVPSGLQAKEIITVCACSRAAAVRKDIASNGCSSVSAASRSVPISPVIGGYVGGIGGERKCNAASRCCQISCNQTIWRGLAG